MSDTELITSVSLEDIAAAIPSLLNDLQEHANMDYSTVHGLWTPLDVQENNAGGTRVSRRKIAVVVGGVTYYLPADPLQAGPPQLPRITQQPQDQETHSKTGSHPPAVFSVTVEGTQPFTFQWQALDALTSVWIDISDGSSGTGFATSSSWNVASVINTATTSNLTINPFTGEHQGVYDPVDFFRCVIDNTLFGGGSTTSNAARLRCIEDEEGSWLIYATHAAAPFSSNEMMRLFKLRRWSLRHFHDETKLYMGDTGFQLVSIMRKHGFDFRTLSSKIRMILSERPYPERFSTFKELIISSFERFWPDCPHPIIVRELEQRRQTRSTAASSSPTEPPSMERES